VALEVRGENARSFLQDSLSSDISALEAEDTQPAWVLERDGKPMSPALVVNAGNVYRVAVPAENATRVAQWFRALSDGYVLFDDKDIPAKLTGPVVVHVTSAAGFDPSNLPAHFSADAKGVAAYKPYFIGQRGLAKLAVRTLAVNKPTTAPEDVHTQLKRTALYETHKRLGAKLVPFAGWEMPVWYGNSSASEEHIAVRNAAGLFDVSHMGVLDISGPNACEFLDAVSTNDVHEIRTGGSLYSYLLDTEGDVIDDIMIYRIARERYLVVINASNNDKDQAWLNTLNNPTDGAIKLPHCQIRDLRDPAIGSEMRVDIALQGPAALKTLLALMDSEADRYAFSKLERTDIMHASLHGLDVFISRTGYTGESIGYEIFVHPDLSVTLWDAILEAGKAFGVRPAGLAARDSTRTEAGLPLYEHELAGPLNLAPYHIGFGGYVKSYKPYFVGKPAYYRKAAQVTTRLSRFRMNQKGVRVPKRGDPVLDARGRVIGTVTSCALDSEGFLLGLAMIETSFGAKDGAAINVMAIPDRVPAPLTTLAPLGSRTLVPDAATVLTRFPKRK
ncbi:MAG TPA: glycine cleavage system aminomethyltransferase GcvT, partial [Anaerolineae bacterium]